MMDMDETHRDHMWLDTGADFEKIGFYGVYGKELYGEDYFFAMERPGFGFEDGRFRK